MDKKIYELLIEMNKTLTEVEQTVERIEMKLKNYSQN